MKLKETHKSVIKTIKINWKQWIIILPSVLLFYFMVWRPIGVGTFLSFFKLQNYKPVEFTGLQNYKDVLFDTLFLKTLKNTASYVIWSLIIGFFPPVILAVMINEIVHGKNFLKFSIYLPVIVPSIAASLIWYFMYQAGDGGFLNMIIGKFGIAPSAWLQNQKITIPLIIVSMTWRGCGSTMIMYLATLQGINQELYEAVRIDGGGLFRRLITITLPHILPVMLLLLIRQIIGVFQVMVEPMTMTGGGPDNASVSLSLQIYNYAFTYFQPERALALGVITFFLLIGITIFYFMADKKIGE